MSHIAMLQYTQRQCTKQHWPTPSESSVSLDVLLYIAYADNYG